MELPNRKRNRLKDYDYSNNGTYFVTICSKNKEHIFSHIVVEPCTGDETHTVTESLTVVESVGDGVLDVPLRYVKVNLSTIGKIAEKHIFRINCINNLSVDKYVIMPNHIHMIISIYNPISADNKRGTSRTPSPTNMTIPRTIAGFKRLINTEVGKNIFQRSYHDHIIRGEKDYEKIWNYIDANPLQWETDCFYTQQLNNKET